MSREALAHTEDEISAFERLEEELREFSYIVSHDLAASIRHLSQFSRLLVKELRGDLTDNQRLYAAHIERAAQRCQTMMERLLTFSRVQQKYLTLAQHDGNRLMESALLQLSEGIATVKPTITVAPLGMLKVDGELMVIALKEAIDNAIKFRPRDHVPTIKVEPAINGDAWALRVFDDGIGIPVEQSEKAFRMFSQLNGEHYPGVGAGLAICQRILRRHGGDASFLPGDGGTCLELSFPKSVHVSGGLQEA